MISPPKNVRNFVGAVPRWLIIGGYIAVMLILGLGLEAKFCGLAIGWPWPWDCGLGLKGLADQNSPLTSID